MVPLQHDSLLEPDHHVLQDDAQRPLHLVCAEIVVEISHDDEPLVARRRRHAKRGGGTLQT
jgi:hypothetical protein